MYVHPNLPLFGPYSVVDRGLLLTRTTRGASTPLACAPLQQQRQQLAPRATGNAGTAAGPGGESEGEGGPVFEPAPLLRAVASFTLPDSAAVYAGAVHGEVALTQRLGEATASTSLDVQVAYTCTRKGYSWSLTPDNFLRKYGPSSDQPAYDTAKRCSDECRKEKECRFWSWASEEARADIRRGTATGDCLLFKGDANETAQVGYVSGNKKCLLAKSLKLSWWVGGGAGLGAMAGAGAGPRRDGDCGAVGSPYQERYNPQGVPDEASECTSGGRRCAVGALSSKYGKIQVPGPGVGRRFTDMHLPLQGPGSVLGRPVLISVKLTAGSTPLVFCGTLKEQHAANYQDVDPLDPKGIAITGLDDAHGPRYYSPDGGGAGAGGGVTGTGTSQGANKAAAAATWDVLSPRAVSRDNALLLPAGGPHRLRFVPSEAFEGIVTCPECPLLRKGTWSWERVVVCIGWWVFPLFSLGPPHVLRAHTGAHRT